MGTKRDDFPLKVKRQIERKSGFRCSNPICGRMTIGPSRDGSKVVNMGVVAHICAAAPNGPRYDASMTPEERRAEDNGLLLCRYCASRVDFDEREYSSELLRNWKEQAYRLAWELLAVPYAGETDPRSWTVIQELVRTCLCAYQTHGQISPKARYRSYAGTLYQLLFEDLPKQDTYDRQVELWLKAVQSISNDVLESTNARAARHNRSFPRQYRVMMEELRTYSLDVWAQKGSVLNVIENTVRSLFQTGEAFGLKENNLREIF